MNTAFIGNLRKPGVRAPVFLCSIAIDYSN